MDSTRLAGQPAVAGAAHTVEAQIDRMRAAIGRAVAAGPKFLSGAMDADHMADTMVAAVRNYLEQERAAGGDGTPHSAEARELQETLAELMMCGSGYLAGRCDAACVARTMTQMVRAFATPPGG